MKPFIYMGYGVNKLIFGITGTEEPKLLLSWNENLEGNYKYIWSICRLG